MAHIQSHGVVFILLLNILNIIVYTLGQTRKETNPAVFSLEAKCASARILAQHFYLFIYFCKTCFSHKFYQPFLITIAGFLLSKLRLVSVSYIMEYKFNCIHWLNNRKKYFNRLLYNDSVWFLLIIIF